MGLDPMRFALNIILLLMLKEQTEMDCAFFFYGAGQNQRSVGRGRAGGGDRAGMVFYGVGRGGQPVFPMGGLPSLKPNCISSSQDGCVFRYAGGDSVRGGSAGNHAHLSGQVPLTQPHHGSLEKHHHDHHHHLPGLVSPS